MTETPFIRWLVRLVMVAMPAMFVRWWWRAASGSHWDLIIINLTQQSNGR
jgi:hypothetical protein